MGLDVQNVGLAGQTKVRINKKNNNQTFSAAPIQKSSTNLVLGMTTAAATAIAGVALYKNHGTQKELKNALEKLTKTENDLKKIIEESKNNIKSTVENVVKQENKEAVKDVTKEVSNNKKKIYTGGTHIDYTSGTTSKEEKTIKKSADDTIDGLKLLEEDAAEARKAKKASDRRNQDWLNEQHKQKEQEYSDWWNKTLLEQETKEGERILNEDALNLRREKKLSDIRNQKWLDEQHKIKEEEMNQLYAENSDKLDELEKIADKRIASKYEVILDKEAAENLQYKKMSDKRNQEWLKAQHQKKEEEYSNWWNKTLFEKEAKEGEEFLKNDADVKIKDKKMSDERNQKWVNEQHDIKEQKMNEFYAQNSENLDKLEQLADERLAKKYETLMKEADLAEQQAIKASDKRNQKWVENQHKLKEKEYSDWWNKALFEKEAKEGERILEEDAAEIRKAKKASDRRNEEWLKEQHRIKEEEMNERYMYNDIEIQYIYFKARVKNYFKSLIKRLFSRKEN